VPEIEAGTVNESERLKIKVPLLTMMIEDKDPVVPPLPICNVAPLAMVVVAVVLLLPVRIRIPAVTSTVPEKVLVPERVVVPVISPH